MEILKIIIPNTLFTTELGGILKHHSPSNCSMNASFDCLTRGFDFCNFSRIQGSIRKSKKEGKVYNQAQILLWNILDRQPIDNSSLTEQNQQHIQALSDRRMLF